LPAQRPQPLPLAAAGMAWRAATTSGDSGAAPPGAASTQGEGSLGCGEGGQDQGSSEQDWNASPEAALAVARAAEARRPEVLLLKSSPAAAGAGALWEPIVEDPGRRSFAYVLRGRNSGLTEEELGEWFEALHPGSVGTGASAWTDAAYRGQRLLRKTAWYVWPPCRCAYDYADTHQAILSEPRFRAAVERISARVAEVCGVASDPPNSVNLNFYPPGGGVGWHSDDEPLFDGLKRETAIISLSLCERGGVDGLGNRWFEVRLKRPFARGASRGAEEMRAVELRHGDLMTMEGLFQLYYLHSAWPGDRTDLLEAPGRSAYGERINMTWRWVVQHGSGCPLASASAEHTLRKPAREVCDGGLRPAPDDVCWDYLKGSCWRGQRCRWRHPTGNS